MQNLLTDPKFWFALYIVAQAVVMQVAPNEITPDLWVKIDGLIAIVIAGITGKIYAGAQMAKAARTIDDAANDKG